MLRKFSNSRTLADNVKLGSLTAFSSGMVNVISVIIFFAFTSNVTGHYAVLAEEIAKGNWYQAGVVASWILLFFFGGFTANLIIINFNKTNSYLAHSVPIILEIICLLIVGSYIQFYYKESLVETEVLVGLMLFAMGIQNGLTASISNSAVKTTHLTGLTTDLGMLFSMFTKKEYRENKQLREKAKVQVTIMSSYLLGGIAAGLIYLNIAYNVFYIVCLFLLVVIGYDFYRLRVSRYVSASQPFLRIHYYGRNKKRNGKRNELQKV
ncbi:YoaK family protein [Echinicola salinicaeni]|uniref:YoaK family protein n=1 Tax=Echinicola salinicaeni TaxID=2762757 RepID=UPI00164766A0|nr:YoaK family protein [Echinicola salinicaeni]